MALSFPILHAKKLMMVLVVLLVLSSVSLAAWGITGADPFTLLRFAFTGHPTFKSVIRYSDEGEVLEDKIVYSLGAPGILEDCIAHSREDGEELRRLEEMDHENFQVEERIIWVQCAKE